MQQQYNKKFPNLCFLHSHSRVQQGRKMVTIIDPHIKRDDGYYIYHEAKEKDFFIKNKHGHEYDGWCWPGSSSYLDFSNPATWNWWADNFALDKYQGTGRVYGQGPITYVKVTCL